MSYASVAAHNAPPAEEQPRPDPALLNTTPPDHSLVADDTAKLNVVPPDFKENPHTSTSEFRKVLEEHQTPSSPLRTPANSSQPNIGNPRKPTSRPQSSPGNHEDDFVSLAKHYFIRPGVAGGLLGLVNIGLLASVGRAFYARPHLRRDAVAISSAIAGVVALISAEGFAAEKYRQTPRGQEEERRARKEGAVIFRRLHEQILRPGVLGGIVGLVNAAVLGTLGYVSYKNWNTAWDKRTVSAISLGLLTLWSGEGVIAEKYVIHK